MKTGIEMIAEERQRQIEKEGWTAEHDDAHTWEELSEAAKCYITSSQAALASKNNVTYDDGYRPGEGKPSDWPWDSSYWKPSGNPVRDLQKAGALIAAEIDRLQRLNSK